MKITDLLTFATYAMNLPPRTALVFRIRNVPDNAFGFHPWVHMGCKEDPFLAAKHHPKVDKEVLETYDIEVITWEQLGRDYLHCKCIVCQHYVGEHDPVLKIVLTKRTKG